MKFDLRKGAYMTMFCRLGRVGGGGGEPVAVSQWGNMPHCYGNSRAIYGITQCYLPPGTGDITISTPANRARQLYKNISMLFLFPVKDGKLSTGVNAKFNASCYG